MIPAAPDAAVEVRGLVYPHGDHVPEAGQMLQVAEGIFWLRMPLPFSLDHINLWLLDGGDHWAIVDTGLALPATRDFWRALFAGPLAGKPVGRVIVTHFHPDHVGLAGWLTRKWQVPLEMTRGEFLLAKVLMLDVAGHPADEVVGFYRSQGWPEAEVAAFQAGGRGGFARAVHQLPTGYSRLRASDRLTIGGRSWEVVVGAGHSPEHACLFDAQSRILISGDQVLPRITSNVSVYPTEPQADPLGDWLDSIAALKLLPAETLVLPAHNAPFRGLHLRLDQLAKDHHEKLAALIEACAEPRTAYESFAVLFRRRIGADDLQMATGEALAHLRWLERRGQLSQVRTGGIERYHRVD